MNISDEAVEAAANVIRERDYPDYAADLGFARRVLQAAAEAASTTSMAESIRMAEVAARALAEATWGKWENVPSEMRGRLILAARITIAAACPFIAAQAWDEGRAAGSESIRQENPYRSGT